MMVKHLMPSLRFGFLLNFKRTIEAVLEPLEPWRVAYCFSLILSEI